MRVGCPFQHRPYRVHRHAQPTHQMLGSMGVSVTTNMTSSKKLAEGQLKATVNALDKWIRSRNLRLLGEDQVMRQGRAVARDGRGVNFSGVGPPT